MESRGSHIARFDMTWCVRTGKTITVEQIGVKDIGERGERDPRGDGMGGSRKNY